MIVMLVSGCTASDSLDFSSSEGRLFKAARNDTSDLDNITISGLVRYKDPDGQCWIFKVDSKDPLYGTYDEITLELPKKLNSAISANDQLTVRGSITSEDAYSISCPEIVFTVDEIL